MRFESLFPEEGDYMIQADDISRVTFDHVVRGYRCEDVDDFLQKIAQQMKEITDKNKEITDKNVALAKRIDQYQQDEKTIQITMTNAQKLGQNIIQTAKEKAAEIIKEAEKKDGRAEIESLKEQLECAKKDYKDLLEHDAEVKIVCAKMDMAFRGEGFQKCDRCGAMWKAEIKQSACPFCQTKLQEKTKEVTTIEEAFAVIVERHGQSIFGERGKLLGLLGDYAPNLKRERGLIKTAVEVGAYKAIYDAPPQEKEKTLNKYVKILEESHFIDSVWARKVLTWCLEAITGKKITTGKETVKDDVSGTTDAPPASIPPISETVSDDEDDDYFNELLEILNNRS